MVALVRPDQFDLNLLRALDALLRERSVTRAAERLHVTQQAMSGSLRRLREQLGDDLLVRAGRGLQLTPRGSALRDPVRDLLLHSAQVLQTGTTFVPAASERSFSVAMSDYAALTVLPAVMAILSADAPGLVLEVELIAGTTVDRLEAGELDFCLLPGDWTLFGARPPRGVCSTALYRDDFVCVVGRVNEAVGDRLEQAEYLTAPHAVLRLGGEVLSIVEAAWRARALAPRIAATATSFAALVLMVSQSPRLVATVQRRLAAQFARMLPIRVLECPVAIEPLQADLSWHCSRDDDPAHRYLRDIFTAAGNASAAHNGLL